jgi:hypothetical protein
MKIVNGGLFLGNEGVINKANWRKTPLPLFSALPPPCRYSSSQKESDGAARLRARHRTDLTNRSAHAAFSRHTPQALPAAQHARTLQD